MILFSLILELTIICEAGGKNFKQIILLINLDHCTIAVSDMDFLFSYFTNDENNLGIQGSYEYLLF